MRKYFNIVFVLLFILPGLSGYAQTKPAEIKDDFKPASTNQMGRE